MILGLCVLGALAGAALGARVGSFHDDFDTLDATRWTATGHALGRSVLDPRNVGVAGGLLRIRLPGGSLAGGEIRSSAQYRYGTFRARIRVPDALTSITGFFLYRPPDFASEIDVEIFNEPGGRVILSTYSGGAQTNSVTAQLPFDPTASVHEYGIDYAPRRVTFTADGTPLASFSQGLPRLAMNLYVSGWFPAWLAGVPPAGDRFAEVDWVDHTAA